MAILFVRPDQIKDEFKRTLELMVAVYADFNITDYRFRLSYRDPNNTDKYFDDDAMWEKAQAMLKAAMDELELDYFEAEGEAAFTVEVRCSSKNSFRNGRNIINHPIRLLITRTF